MSAPPARRTFTLLVLLGINTMNFYDRQVLGAVAEPIRAEWDLDDRALGALGTAFTLLYAAVGLPLGRAADAGRRTTILLAGVLLWSVTTSLSGLAGGFWSLFLVRLLVGVGEASCAPAANSLLGDLYPPGARARALSVFMLGLPLGLGLGFTAAGAIARAWGWRVALVVAGLPGLLFGLLLAWVPEPARGAAEGPAVGAACRPGSPLLNVLRIPTMGWLILSGALHNFNMYALGQFLSPYLIRYHGLDVAGAGLFGGVVYGFGGGAGLLLGGWACDRAAGRRAGGRLEVAAAALVASALCAYLALGRPPGDGWGFGAWLLPACLLSYVYYAGVYPAIQDVVEPARRGTAVAVYFLAMYLLGAALGPVLTGWASDAFARRAALADGAGAVTAWHRALGLHQAMGLIPLLALALAGVLFAAARTVGRDQARLQAWMKATAAE
jgi:MFS family permease